MSEKSIAIRMLTRFRGLPWLSDLLAGTGNSMPHHSWIFIVGSYNSGTTLLEQILSEHPDISGMQEEGVMLTDVLKRPEDFGWRRMWWKCEPQMKVPEWIEAEVASRVKRQWSHFYDKSKSFLVEKSISNTTRLPFLERNFQPAFFIHLVRDGYAVAEGIRRRAVIMPQNPYEEAGAYPIEVCAQQWKRSLQVVEENQAGLKNFMEVRYEDLSEIPDIVLQGICSFLGIDKFQQSFTGTSFNIHQEQNRIGNMNEGSIARLTNEEIEIFNEVAGDYLVKYGYHVRHADTVRH